MNNCLGHNTPARCIIFSDGKTLEEVIDNVETVPPISSEPAENVSASAVNLDVTIEGASTCASDIVYRNFNYKYTPGLFTYNTDALRENLPEKYTILSSRARVFGTEVNNSTLVSESSASSAGLSVPVSRFPILMTLDIRLRANCGDIDLSGVVRLSGASNIEASSRFKVTEFSEGTNTPSNLEEYILALEHRLADFSKISTDVFTISTEVANLGSQIHSLQEAPEIPTPTDLYNRVSDIESDLTNLTEQINSIQTTLTQIQALL